MDQGIELQNLPALLVLPVVSFVQSLFNYILKQELSVFVQHLIHWGSAKIQQLTRDITADLPTLH